MKKEFTYVFQITRKIIFEVRYYTLGSNKNPYFTTSAAMFNQPKTDYCRCGQCQEDVLTGVALDFYKKWDKLHLHDLTESEYWEILADIGKLKERYNCIEVFSDNFSKEYTDYTSFWRIRALSMQKVKKEGK